MASISACHAEDTGSNPVTCSMRRAQQIYIMVNKKCFEITFLVGSIPTKINAPRGSQDEDPHPNRDGENAFDRLSSMYLDTVQLGAERIPSCRESILPKRAKNATYRR